MIKEQLEILNEYIKINVSPILLENTPTELIKDEVVISSDCDDSYLNGHYEGIDFKAPKWYEELQQKSKNRIPILVIKDINKIDETEQKKFIEILKYKKISTFHLPENCIIIVTCSNLKEKNITEEIYSLVAHIERK